MPDVFGGGGGRLYRTGDVVRWLADGLLEFVGRLDFQVKVRGFRVELGEVEAVVAAQSGVRDAVVVAWGEEGARRLVAYVVALGERVEVGRLRDGVAARLPEYMVPSLFVWLDALPLTANGKVDRAGLPPPVFGGDGAGYVPPRSEVERVLVGVWERVLGVARVGVHDNFFDLGGDSLLAVRLAARMREIWVWSSTWATSSWPTRWPVTQKT